MDTGFWQKVRFEKSSMLLGETDIFCVQGFSADVASAVPGYVLGGVASFSVPWAFGTIVGLGALALENTPAWPTYPRVSLSPSSCKNGVDD